MVTDYADDQVELIENAQCPECGGDIIKACYLLDAPIFDRTPTCERCGWVDDEYVE